MTTQSGLGKQVRTFMTGGELPVILVAAVVQGWSLYGLHMAIDNETWPATSPGWLAAFYALAVFVPLTVQVLSQHARQPLTWVVIAAVGAFYLFAGWHHGAWVLMQDGVQRIPESDNWFALAFLLAVLWLLVMPFVQARLIGDRWRCEYSQLFASAWNNKLLLAEAFAFTGLFWLLLFLWSGLFKMLGIRFFAELFEEPIFVYPVTSIVFGIALNLIGSLDRFTRVVLEQALSVLKWLALVAAVVLALFTVALATRLPGMISSGERAISATWLLWLVAVTVLLVNAAYRDGTTQAPYPRWIGLALRCVVPLTVIVALTALYALGLRVNEYGFTVSRVWACVVAGAAIFYSVGYAFASRSKQQWMGGISQVNVATALYLIVIIALGLTPLLSPYRIAANSQFRMAQSATSDAAQGGREAASMEYLRFESGRYGAKRLNELAHIEGLPNAPALRKSAAAMQARQHRWDQNAVPADPDVLLSQLVSHQDRPLDAALRDQLQRDLREPALTMFRVAEGKLGAIFVDLDGDQVDEFVLMASCTAAAYHRDGAAWKRVGLMYPDRPCGDRDVVVSIQAGDFRAETPTWRDLVVGKHRFRQLTDGD